jgi:hypothetical protein
MSFTAVALVVGVLLGIAAGGRPSNIGRRQLRLAWLLAICALLQVVAEVLDVPQTVGLVMVLASYAGLSAFALSNIGLVGMPVVLVGLLANLLVIGLNAGMPVRESSILAAHASTPAEVHSIDFGAKRHLATDDDRLEVLGDILPVRPTREVLSFGDLILAFGVAVVIFRLLRPADARRRRVTDVIDVTDHTRDDAPERAPRPQAHLVDA